MPDLTTNYQMPIPLTAETELNDPAMWRDPITVADTKIKSEMLDKLKAWIIGSGNIRLFGTAFPTITWAAGWGPNTNDDDCQACFRGGMAHLRFYVKRTGAPIVFPANGKIANTKILDLSDPRFRPQGTNAIMTTGCSTGVYLQGWVQWLGGVNLTSMGISSGPASITLGTGAQLICHAVYVTTTTFP